MKKFTLITIFYLLFTNLSFAETYPNSCPAEAQAIVKAVGGCSAVKKNQYPSVYEKCCALPAPSAGSGQAPVTPKPTPVKAPTPSITPSQQLKPIQYSEPFRDVPKLTPAQELTPSAQLENKPLKIIREGFRRTFDRLFRFLRFR